MMRPSARSPGTMPIPTAMASAGLASRRPSPRAVTVVGSPPAPNRPRVIRSAPLPRSPAQPPTSRPRPRPAATPSGCASHSGSLAGGGAGGRSGAPLLAQPPNQGGDGVAPREAAAGGNRRHPPVAQHGTPIRDGHHLIETVGNVDDGSALPLHARQHRKQARDLAFFERR